MFGLDNSYILSYSHSLIKPIVSIKHLDHWVTPLWHLPAPSSLLQA